MHVPLSTPTIYTFIMFKEYPIYLFSLSVVTNIGTTTGERTVVVPF